MTQPHRNGTRPLNIGPVAIGGGAPVVVQSMTNTDTRDAGATLEQIRRLHAAGCELVRLAVPDAQAAAALKTIASHSPVPLVADVHFDYRLALAALDAGLRGLRINPGNIGGQDKVRCVAAAAKAHGAAIRVGVNSGSVEKEMLRKYGGPTPEALVESALAHVRMLEQCGFFDTVISLKSSSVTDTIASYRLMAARSSYPLHLGVTEAGTPMRGTVKSSVGMGILLAEGIGDTIRVSLSEAPEREIPVARKLVDYAETSAGVRASARIENGVLRLSYNDTLLEDFQLHAAMDAGALLIDGRAQDLELSNPNMSAAMIRSTEDAILQGARIRFTKPEYISCPGCGRTLYNLEETIARIKAATGHLKGVKIAIMGCIVNGPGEMADADFGYVGAGRGKISLYRGKECIEKNIPEENAVERLLQLIEETTKR